MKEKRAESARVGANMRIRIGKVTNTYPSTGKVKVMYEDEGSASLPLSMLTMNQEYSMPAVGDRVVTIHMENGSCKGFVLGTYYGGGMQPKANAGYRKDFGSGVYVACRDGAYLLSAGSVSIKGGSRASVSAGGAAMALDGDASLVGATVVIGSAAASEEAGNDISIKAQNIMVEAEEITLKCSYGEITVEELMKRLDRLEDRLEN